MLGLYGVAVFFAISGYLMAELSVRQDPFEFITRRVFRIYPTFLIATLLAIAILPSNFLGHYSPITATLVPAGSVSYPLRVEWTLVNEIFFYVALFCLSVARATRWIAPLAVVWLASIIIDSATSTEFTRIGKATLFEMPLMLANAGFAAGLLVPSLARRVHQPALMATAFAGSIAIAHFVPSNFVRITCGIGAGFLILAAVQSTLALPKLLHRVLASLGDWSYALYLIHVPVIVVAYTHFAMAGRTALPLAVGLSTIAASALGRVDIGIHRAARQMISRMPRDALIAFGSLFVSAYFGIALWIEFGGNLAK